MPRISRREFIGAFGASGVALATARAIRAAALSSPFRVAVITDEITQDFGRACEIAAREFGMGWVEVRSLWDKNIADLDDKQSAEAKRILQQYNLRVTDIGSPFFKTDWPGAPKSKYSPKQAQFGAQFTFAQQDEVLEKSIAAAKRFGTDRVRCFDFWRLDDPSPYRAAMDAKLLDAAAKAGKQGITLVLENEFECNTATGAEAARTLKAVQSPNFMLNWDPGNAVLQGDTPFPNGYSLLPKNRIGHCHCKDARKKADGSGYEWAPMGGGVVDWVGQFRALKRDGYHFAVSLETHWRGAKSPEESTRQSWAGMKRELQQAGALEEKA
jgi:sugar phosphate isomerase/epimerase